MSFLTESYQKRIGQLAGIIPLDEAIKFSAQDITKTYDKSWQRIVGFDLDMIKQAIREGRAIGISYKSENMPVTKFRVVLPVTFGNYKTKEGVPLKLSAYHLAGQSERASHYSGKRSQEASGVWRLFDLDPKSFKGMWFSDKFFYEYPPGYKKGDRRFASITTQYDVGTAEAEKINRETKGEKDGEPIELRTAEPTKTTTPVTAKTPETTTKGVEKTTPPENLTEKEKNALYVKKPWLKFLRKGFMES